MVGLSERAVTAVMLGAHLLAALALVAFGWRAGGFALNGTASYTYLVLVVAAALVFVVTMGRDDDWVRAARVVVGPALALIIIGAWMATSTAGAKYADWGAVTGDQLPVQALWQVGYAGLGSILALMLRWPRLLLVWALTHALILVGGLAVLGQWAFLILLANAGEGLPLLLAPLAYALAGLALGWRPGRLAPTTARRSPVTFSWAAMAPAAWFTLATAQRWLSPTVLPQAGQSQGWYTPAQTVPMDAWSPAIAWARALFALVPYFVVVVVALGLAASWPALRRLRLGATTLMVGLGLAVLASVKVSLDPPLLHILASVDGEGSWFARLLGMALPLERLLLLVGIGFGLLLVARLWDQAAKANSQRWLRTGLIALLILNALGQAASAWPFLRFLIFGPQNRDLLVFWSSRLAPNYSAGLGLGMHLALLIITLLALAWFFGQPRQLAEAAPALVGAAR